MFLQNNILEKQHKIFFDFLNCIIVSSVSLNQNCLSCLFCHRKPCNYSPGAWRAFPFLILQTFLFISHQAQAELTEKQRELSHCEELIKVLTADRNRALTTLRQHGIPMDHSIKVSLMVELRQLKYEFIYKLKPL